MSSSWNWKKIVSLVCIVLSAALLFTGWLTFQNSRQKKQFMNGIESAMGVYQGIGGLFGKSDKNMAQADSYAKKVYVIFRDGELSPLEVIQIGSATGKASAEVEKLLGIRTDANDKKLTASVDRLVMQIRIFSVLFLLSLVLCALYLVLHIMNRKSSGYPLTVIYLILGVFFMYIGRYLNGMTNGYSGKLLAMRPMPFAAAVLALLSGILWQLGYREQKAGNAGMMQTGPAVQPGGTPVQQTWQTTQPGGTPVQQTWQTTQPGGAPVQQSWQSTQQNSQQSGTNTQQPTGSAPAQPGFSPDSGVRYCPWCGAQVPAGAHFCSKCGKRI